MKTESMRRFEDIQKFLQNIGHKGGLIDGNYPVCNTGRGGRQGRCDILRPADLGKIIEHDDTPFPCGRERSRLGTDTVVIWATESKWQRGELGPVRHLQADGGACRWES